jgi:putative phosphoribosyl transferase
VRRRIRRALSVRGGEAIFKDRADAGRRLAERLAPLRDEDPIVLALPRGGVPVGVEISRVLDAPLDVFISRKLGAPDQPELGIGAVAQGGTRVLNEDIVQQIGIPDEYIEEITHRELAEVGRRLRILRGGRPEPEVRDRTAILVDDGLATGVTARAAVSALRERNPRRLVLAVPVCPPRTARILAPEVDRLICLRTPEDFVAVGLWYRDFEQVTDDEVVELLEKARRERGVQEPQ